MNRKYLQDLTQQRLSDAKVLLTTGTNSAGAYYLAGYVIECALKACIAKNQGEYPYPDFGNKAFKKENYFSHDPVTLLETAGLKGDIDSEIKTNMTLAANWAIVKGWNESFRYETNILQQQAKGLIEAIDDPQNGVLQWLKNYW